MNCMSDVKDVWFLVSVALLGLRDFCVVFLMQAHLGKQAIVRYYFPPEVDYRLSLLPPNCKGLVLWVIEAKVSNNIVYVLVSYVYQVLALGYHVG